MVAWPDGLPFFNSFEGRSKGGYDNAVITHSPSIGPAITRRRTTAATRPFTGVTGKMTKAQIAVFEDFVRASIAFGALPFTAKDPFDCMDKEFRLVDFDIRPHGTGFRVFGTLVIQP